MKIELRLAFCTCGREKKPVRRKVRVGGSSGSARYSAMACGGRHARRRQEQFLLAHADFDQVVEHLAAEHLVDALVERGDRRDVQQFRGRR